MALRRYGRLWRKAVDPLDGFRQLWFRADISYPGFSRDMLWGITDIAYYRGLDDRSVRFADNRRMLHRRPFYFAEYGSANKIAASNTGTAVWCLDAWFRGASGEFVSIGLFHKPQLCPIHNPIHRGPPENLSTLFCSLFSACFSVPVKKTYQPWILFQGEIIINMIVHRDYMAPGDSIIKIFDESIEFFNPGRLAGGLTAEQLTSGNYISAVRNKQIALIFKEAGLIEKYGSGIKRARLHVCSASPETPFLRVGVSSVAGDWQEGSSFWYFYQAGSACFSRAAYKHRDWAFEVAQPG
ncbi:MAG: hypothetical protein LC660_17770 [Desulfobacteraceae bacterium]|nr:hypothetical protein [Desulfobacteraceae bacterium]